MIAAATMRERIERSGELMLRFADRTGVTADRPARRYLWTDAFAVCNFLGLAAATGDAGHGERALRLIERVHAVLGRHRADDARTGWLSGLGPREGEAHPTRGGLRIGKPLPERRRGESLDEQLEWDRDGQYFHYLTKWMHALDQAARATGQMLFNVWARELAATAHRAFVYVPPGGGGKRMYWKMSVDLSRPQVASMGHHDPLDGLVTCAQLEATAGRMRPPDPGPHLATMAADFAALFDPTALATADPLGLGGLLVDASRLAQLTRQGAWPKADGLLASLLVAAGAGLQQYAKQPDLRAPAAHRLAFRELGLAIGLAAVERMRGDAADWAGTGAALDQLARYAPVRTAIESFWLVSEHRRQRTWLEHEDINDVMLATMLLPDGFLVLPTPAEGP
jgi:hypothetical protein